MLRKYALLKTKPFEISKQSGIYYNYYEFTVLFVFTINIIYYYRRDRKKSRSPRRSRSPRSKRKSQERKPEEVPFDPTNPDKVKFIDKVINMKKICSKIYFSQH